jgi:predicted ATPase
MRADLPTGTVTFLFSDVEGSTRLLHELGAEAYANALAEHRRTVREACAAKGGVEVDTQGDGFFFAFATAPQAVEAALEITAALTPAKVRVRIGVHTGTPLLTEGGYVGLDVHRAARIAAAGHGGQVLVSASTARLVEFELRDLGEHRLKDLAAPERIYQLGGGDFPRLKSLYQTNLPVPATPFLGRERELAEVVAILSGDDLRLVTLTGPGGTGKTRLALQAAADVSDDFPDGTWWIPLSALRDPLSIAGSVALPLGVKEVSGTPLRETLVEALTGKRMLLLLDSVEHLLPDAAREVSTLAATSGSVFVVTSRERLHLQGEQVYPVPTLDERDGVSLFTARARSLDPGFEQSGAVAELCSRLDQLPLALELAAARTVLFSAEELLARLGERLDLLRGVRDIDPRQQTLRATIEWSHELLSAEERELFRSLAVFSGSWSYEAAEAIVGADPDNLQSLLDKSLVRRRDSRLGRRYWMLETIQTFAGEQLADSSDADALRDRHLAWYSEAVFARRTLARAREPEALAFFREEEPNVEAAMERALETSDTETAQKLLLGFWFLWMTSGLAAQGDDWAGRVAALPSERTADYAWVLGVAGEFPRFRDDPERALVLKERSLTLFDELGLHEPHHAHGAAAVLSDLCDVLVQLGDVDRATASAQRALELRRSIGDPRGIAHALTGVATVAMSRGAFEEAAERFSETVRLYDSCGQRFEAAGPLAGLGFARQALGDLPGATSAFDDSLTRALESGNRVDAAAARGGLGLVAADEGRTADAVTLLAPAVSETRDLGVQLYVSEEIDSTLEKCRAELGDAAYESAYANGVTTAAILKPD